MRHIQPKLTKPVMLQSFSNAEECAASIAQVINDKHRDIRREAGRFRNVESKKLAAAGIPLFIALKTRDLDTGE